MRRHITSITDVAEGHLCCGCGTCAYVQPEAITMVDVPERGRRPVVRTAGDGSEPSTAEAVAACPGREIVQDQPLHPGAIPELAEEWGPVLELWEGHATDPEVRFRGSSGGAATALAIHGLVSGSVHGVLHAAARDDVPYLNTTVLSRSAAEVLSQAGSRYAPASPAEHLQEVQDAPGPCIFIGKPCDVAGAATARRTRPALDEKLALTIAVFCAGTPSTQGTLEMLAAVGVEDPSRVESVRYRGNGWPGAAEIVERTDDGPVHHRLTYDESWGEILQRHRQWRCYVCADHTGELADVAVGDPWYRPIGPDEPGTSLILVRTERGRRFLAEAREAGALRIERVDATTLPAAQPNLLRARGNVWGRSMALRALGVPAPRFEGMSTFGAWRRHLSRTQKVQSFTGTAKRVVTKRLYRRDRSTTTEPQRNEPRPRTAPDRD